MKIKLTGIKQFNIDIKVQFRDINQITNMSEFTRLLRNSRLSALPKNSSKHKGNKFPSQQIIETRANALARDEWGLKSSLPSKIKSRFITFNDLDNMERIVDFETGGSFHWKQKRFQEMNIVPNFDTPRKNPLFFNDVADSHRFTSLASLMGITDEISPKNLNKILDSISGLRVKFEKYLLKKDPIQLKNKSFTQEEFASHAIDFLSSIKTEQPITSFNQLNLRKGLVKGTGGLSYGLKGRLTNSPNGIKSKFIGTGRFATTSPNSRIVAFGGFFGETSNTSSNLQFNKTQSDGKVPREVNVPFSVERAVLQDDGSVNLKLDVVNRHISSALGNDSTYFRNNQKQFNRSKVNNREKRDTVQDLLALIREGQKKR
ncbi:hypothetical protein BN7_1654 [Wickerhamomyces ciferrii]|uniref:37S ribosomal protein MRP51, mitochondrial n=1 Tax=Wickerhamomyces ciferrii (strain ATCC 14091 / BCRC 22168 / CBS 111 / JCM 3599 / NBRC 0793 / NRRL Y-1031 F-60-10) TaxID=1206466 RepID=K0KGK3_WICCF|nr:uncharacterized protein BN7_1654 [Wickerhamomyces ciferrii]CCH42111.1 hypothetical protein BN7_1654 [Wickerhamomyces ciferrii]